MWIPTRYASNCSGGATSCASGRTTPSADLRHEADPLSADFAEQVTQRENDDVLGAISDSARVELEQVEPALRRLAAGRYGICVVCGEDDRAGAPRGGAVRGPLLRAVRSARASRAAR